MKVGDKELVYLEDASGAPEIYEITLTETGENGQATAKCDGVTFHRVPPAGDSPSGYLTWYAEGKSYRPLSHKKGVTTEPEWLKDYPYYQFCAEHGHFYRTEEKGTCLGCFGCYKEADNPAIKPIATNW